jgi:methionyl-tRNA synthetase
MPSVIFDNTHEAVFKEMKATLPKHKSKYAAGKKILIQFEDKSAMQSGAALLKEHGIPSEIFDAWAHRSITRDVTWGIPFPPDVDAKMEGKTLYVWPDSLIAPISFSQVALKEKGKNPESYKEFWCDPEAKVFQFLGQDNVYFYVLMQGALWFGSQKDPNHMPVQGDYQLTDIFGCFHLMVGGEKMSKSRGNFYTADQLISEMGYDVDQIRYFLTLLSLPEKSSNFDFENLKERNKFLAGPLNAAFEKPISACHSKFGGIIPNGELLENVKIDTARMLQRYFRSMERAEYSTLLFAIENYARTINSLFVQYKPHDDRVDETQRNNGLFTCFYVLKNIMIMLYPFVPFTMDKLRSSLNLPESIFNVEELGTPIMPGHKISEKQQYFPTVEN